MVQRDCRGLGLEGCSLSEKEQQRTLQLCSEALGHAEPMGDRQRPSLQELESMAPGNIEPIDTQQHPNLQEFQANRLSIQPFVTVGKRELSQQVHIAL
jgi:hypothetical protein